MRNLKRALSLTLASVMLLGMMVVGSSAAAGFPDVDEKDNIEAIEVLQAVEVMVGDDRGFGPDRPVTRNEMAVVMGKLLNLNYNYYSSTCPFTDVAEWARGWVGACYANGIVSGRGEGIYDGEATVTAVEAASMMMRALGYFKYTEDYADGFQLVTVRQGNQIGIFNEVGTDASTPMTRNQVAQMALNALRSELVDFTGTPGMEVNGVKVGYRAEYTPRTSTESKYNAIEGRTSDVATELNHKGQYYVQLGEELYDGDLRLNNKATDDFGRPSRYWEYDGKAIGTYMKKELLRQEWTVEVTGKDFYDLLGADTIKNYSFDITIDGVAVDGKTGTTVNNDVLEDDAKSYFTENVMAKTYKSGVGKTGKGVLTQVFVNPNTEEVDVAVINTYLAKAASDYSEKRDELKLNVYGVDSTGSNENTVWFKEPEDCSEKDQTGKSFTVSSEDFDVKDMKKDDIVLVTQANGEIKTMFEPEVISAATLNAFSKDNYVINDGTQYDYNTTIEYDPDTLDNYTGDGATQQLKDTSYNLYLDAYGYLIGVDVVDAVRNYIFLTGIDQGTSNLNNKVSDAAGILLDGTFVNFRMNMTDSKTAEDTNSEANPDASKSFKGHALWNTWCTYTVDKDGTYTLTEVKYNPNFNTTKEKAGQWHDLTANAAKIDTKRVALKAGSTNSFAYGNDNSVYIVPETKTVAARDVVEVGFRHPSDTSTPGTVGTEIDVGDPVIIISGVESRGTGIDTVSLETWNMTNIKANTDNSAAAETWPGNIYTLYDDDNYIIGAVVVGEDTGASKNWVYVNSDGVKRETYDRDEDEYTWVREVIKDGVSTDLTEKGSGLSELKTMKENAWYEVTYKANGSVKSVDLAYFSEGDGKLIGGIANPAGNDHKLTLGYTGYCTNANFTANVNDLEEMNVDGKSTYLYEEVWGLGDDDNDVSTGSSYTTYNHTTNKSAMGLNNQPSLTGGTLYVDTVAKKGLYVATDVKSVLIQKNDGKKTTTYGENRDDLKEMLDDLNYDNGSYLFKISAVVKDGRATTVIIHDWNETDARGNDKDRNPGGGGDVKGVKLEGNRIVVTRNDTNAGNGNEVRSDIMNFLEANGYNLVSIAANTTGRTGVGYAGAANWQVIATKGGTTYTFNSDLIVMVPMVINGENVEKLLGDSIANNQNGGTGYVKGPAVQAVPGAASTYYTAGAYTVAWADRASAGNVLRTDTFIVTENGQTGGYYRVDDELTLNTNTGKHVVYDTNKTADIAAGGKVTIKADMAGQTLTPGYFKISVRGDATKVDYVLANATTTTKVTGLTGTWVKTDDSTHEYVKLITGGKINPAQLTGVADAIDKDIEIIDQGYYEIPAATTDAGTAKKGLTITIADNAGERYAKANEVVTYSVTIKGEADDSTNDVVVKIAGGTDAKVAPALDTVPTMEKVTKTNGTTLTFEDGALAGETDGITVTVTMTVDNKDVSAAVTVNVQ